MLQDQLKADPAIRALIDYAAAAPAIVCDEGYWDDMDDANGDGMIQERSEAADLIRRALTSLGIDPPKGIEVCSDCFRDLDDHHSQCQAEDEEGDDHEA